MIKTTSFKGPSALLFLCLLGVLFILGFPLLIITVGAFLVISFVMRLVLPLFRPHPRSESRKSHFDPHFQDPRISPVIDNKNIGPYRVRKDDSDPDVIEVVDRPSS